VSGERGGWPVKLGDILAPALERVGSRAVMAEANLRKVWRDVVGEQVAAAATVRRLRGTVLDVDVSSDAWATELTYLAGEIVSKLNAKLGAGAVSEIRVQRHRKPRA
jgi:predicted nucleic acid-binding Zn ribbon protein